ncbi:MAG: hypothetical protein ABIO67_07300 [Mycobacteriales bacterium]
MTCASRAALGAGLAIGLQRAIDTLRPGGDGVWTRLNHRGDPVSLASGPALAIAGAAALRLPLPAAMVAGLGAGLVGAYDDAADAAGGLHAKGLRGHLAALRSGRVTSGAVKVVGLAAVGGATARLLGRRTPVDLMLGTALIAGSANLLNLLDLRPGRALKVGVVAALAQGQPGLVAATGALLPDDLAERTMLGDTGANALGALLGAAALHRHSRRTAWWGLVGIVGLTGLSEVTSYTRIIEASPPLRWADQLGRLR